MSFVITCEIICDGCNEHYDGGIMQADSSWKRDTLIDAKQEGWTSLVIHGKMSHFCQECSS